MMNFYDWKTHYQTTRDQLRSMGGKILSIDEYIAGLRSLNKPIIWPTRELDIIQIFSEIEWINTKRPYYNLMTNILEPALRMKIDIPIKLLDVPRDYKTVLVKFPIGNPFGFEGILSTITNGNLYLFIKSINNKIGYLCIHLNDEMTIEEYLLTKFEEAKAQQDLTEEQFEKGIGIMNQTLRFYALTQFLSNCPDSDLINFDVLKTHEGEYNRSTSNERRKEIENISKRGGKIGWNIGVSERILGPMGRLSKSSNGIKGESEIGLTNAHIRTGHLHCVRFGPAKNLVKVMWFRPTVVRPDLPFKE